MSKNQFRGRYLGSFLASAILVTSLTTSPALAQETDSLATFYTQSLLWTECDGAMCTRVTVPLDYAKPEGDTITLSVRRIGSPDLPPLVMNPGGPGSEGTHFAQSIASSLDPAVTASFTPVGFDPRGTGDSAPVRCFTGRSANKWLRTDSTPDTIAEQVRYMSAAAKISPACQRFSPTIAPHVGTENTVRDMDIIRGVLGSEKLNWLGFSYGTSLGVRYAESFPSKVGRMVLDGAVDPSLNAMELSQGQSIGFQKAIKRFDRKYPGSIAFINTLLALLDSMPMKTDGLQKLSQSEASTAIFLSMYNTSFWPPLHDALTAAKRGDGSLLQELSYYANDQTGPTTFSSNSISAFISINCWDFPQTPERKGLARKANRFAKKASVPELAMAMSWGNAPCSNWLGHSLITPAPANTRTTAPILIVGTTFDPATPISWARSLNKQLPTSSLLTYAGDGHTAYLGGNECVDRVVDQFLLTGVSPTSTRC